MNRTTKDEIVQVANFELDAKNLYKKVFVVAVIYHEQTLLLAM